MQGGGLRPSYKVKVRNEAGGQGGHGGHGGGNGNGHAGGGGGEGNANGEGDDTTSTTVALTQETTTAAISTTTTTKPTSAVETSAQAKTSTTSSVAASDTLELSAAVSTTATAPGTSATAAGLAGIEASSTVSSNELTSGDSGSTPSQTTTAQRSSETSSGAASALSAPSSTSSSSSTNSSSSSASGSSSHAGIIAGVIVGLIALIAIGFILYRFRRTRPIQRILTPFHKTADSQSGPYQNIEKSDNAMASNVTGETVAGINNMRATGPSNRLPGDNIRAAGVGADNHLTLDTEYLGAATTGSVSPVSTVSDLAPEVSPISSSSWQSNNVPPQPRLARSNAPGPGSAVSIAGSEARIVSIPPRSSRAPASTSSIPPGSARNLMLEGRQGPSGDSVDRRPPGSPRTLTGNGRAWQPPRQSTAGSAKLRPQPLSTDRSRQAPMRSHNAPRSAGDVKSAGYTPYRPPTANVAQGPPHRASRGSMGHASTASSDGISLTDAISWPKPPQTPTVIPDRH